MTAQVLTHPRFAPTHRTVRLFNLNGVEFASAGFPCNVRDPGAPWDWIRETVSHELGVNEDDVGCEEADDGDMVTVCGVRTYRLTIGC